MIQIRKPGVDGPTPISPQSQEIPQADDRSLFILPKESGINKAYSEVDQYLIITKAALKGIGILPSVKEANGWRAQFYRALIEIIE